MAYTTPRTGNVADVFTASWYNAEIKSNIVWAHDTLLSVGSTFPASPLAGQRHVFVSGDARKQFVSDGTNWYSEPERTTLLAPLSGVGSATTATSLASILGLHLINVAAFMSASITLQAKVGGTLAPGSVTSVHVGLSVKTVAAAGSTFSAETNASSSGEITGATGWREGAWVTLLAPTSAIVAAPGLYYYISGGLEGTFVGPLYVELRWKK